MGWANRWMGTANQLHPDAGEGRVSAAKGSCCWMGSQDRALHCPQPAGGGSSDPAPSRSLEPSPAVGMLLRRGEQSCAAQVRGVGKYSAESTL